MVFSNFPLVIVYLNQGNLYTFFKKLFQIKLYIDLLIRMIYAIY